MGQTTKGCIVFRILIEKFIVNRKLIRFVGDPETSIGTIALKTMRLRNICLGTGDLGMTVHKNLPGTMTRDGMKPARTSESGEMIFGGREAGASIDGSWSIRK